MSVLVNVVVKIIGGSYHVSIPHPNRVPNTYFPHEQAIHPTETELNKFNSFLLKVLRKSAINSRSQVTQG